jgi:hypothetical protein
MHYNQCERDQIHYVSKMLTQISGVIFPRQMKEKNIYINVCRGTNPVFADRKPLYFCQCGHLTTLVYAAPSENEETLYQNKFMPLASFVTASGPLAV